MNSMIENNINEKILINQLIWKIILKVKKIILKGKKILFLIQLIKNKIIKE